MSQCLPTGCDTEFGAYSLVKRAGNLGRPSTRLKLAPASQQDLEQHVSLASC